MYTIPVPHAFKYRIYPTAAQKLSMLSTLDLLRELYNGCLQNRRDAWQKGGVSVSAYDQMKALKEVREVRPEFKEIHTHLLQDVVTRLDRAYDAFFRRVREGAEKPGFPRFKGRDRYHSFTFKDAVHDNGVKILKGGKRIRLSGVGEVKVKLHRPFEGTVKQVTVSHDGTGRWYASLVCTHVHSRLLPPTGEDGGVDVGINPYAAFSDGTIIEAPKLLRAAQKKLKRAQRTRAKKKPHGSNRRKAQQREARQHRKVANARRDFQFKLADRIVKLFDRIAVEDLDLLGMVRGILSRSFPDAGLGDFLRILTVRAANAGRILVAVDPRGTSQNCSRCGFRVPKDLSVRVHSCQNCGLVLDRDVNAACNILGRGRRLWREPPSWGVLWTQEAPVQTTVFRG